MKTAFRTAAAAAALSLIALDAAAQAPRIPAYDAAGLAKACDQGLARVRGIVAEMSAKPGAAGVFEEWTRLFIETENAANPAYLYAGVHPAKEVRAAAEACVQKFNDLDTEVNQNERLFRRVDAAKPADPRLAKLRRDLLRNFEDAGVALPEGKRAQAKELIEKIDKQRIEFVRNMRDDPTKVTFTAAEMQGLPDAYLKARKPDSSGNYVLGLDQPSYGSFMQNARDAAARERYYRARLRQGGEANLGIMEQQFLLRRDLAGLYGYPSFAHYALRKKMAQSPENVDKFLKEVRAAVAEGEKRDLEDLRGAKAADLGTSLAQATLFPWDTAFYAEKLRRERQSVDQEKLRAYFPADKSVDFVLLVASRMYGLKFVEAPAAAWHPDLRYFEVRDAGGRYLANFYVDLFPREGKRSGAFAAPLRSASKLAGRTPSVALVCNFFVEAPSQMFEEWGRRSQALALFKEVCPQCPVLSTEEVRSLEAARRFGQSIGTGRQLALAAFDMEMSLRPRAPLDAWKGIESTMPLGYTEGTIFPAAFQHIMSSYGAGYYGYMWSLVIARDLLSQFERDMLDTRVAARYRESILGAGTEREEAEMVKRFLGRDPDPKAFFDYITGKS